MKILVVGGVAGGASVAARARRLDEHAEVIVFEKGRDVSFSNCCLPYHLSGMIDDSKKLILMNPTVFDKQYNIDVRVNSEVVKINRDVKTVTVKNVLTGESYDESYDKLVLSPGADAIVPPIKGIETASTFIVKNVVDLEKLTKAIHDKNAKKITVVGGGFIGVECAENLKEGGFDVSLVEAQDQVMRIFDKDMAQIIHKEIVDKGINLVLGDCVSEFQGNDVILASKKVIKSDLVVMAIGVKPCSKLAKDAGLELAARGAIKVDQNYVTNDRDILAVGDAILVRNELTKQDEHLPLAGPAQKQARAAADFIYGRPVNNTGYVGSSCIKIFDYHCAATGLTEKACEAAGIEHDSVYIIPNDIVGLMPKKHPIHYKLVFEVPTGKVLGAQAIGMGNVVKHVDTVATLIKFGGTLEDLRDLELCYAPPFSTAKDVVNMAALVALNILHGEFKQVHVDKVYDLVKEGAVIIDAREKAEYDAGHILTAKNIPMSEFRQRLDEFPKDKPFYVHCRSGQRSYNVVRALQQLGFTNAINISGGFMGVCFNEYVYNKFGEREVIVDKYNFN